MTGREYEETSEVMAFPDLVVIALCENSLISTLRTHAFFNMHSMFQKIDLVKNSINLIVHKSTFLIMS